MKRFFGMMPSSEIDREENYRDNGNYKLRIQAGPHGWTVIYADGSTNYKDEDGTTEENFQKAYKVADEAVGPLIPVSGEDRRMCMAVNAVKPSDDDEAGEVCDDGEPVEESDDEKAEEV